MEREDVEAVACGGRRALRKQERRETIIRAARESFMERGYAGTSMSGLLDRLGGSKATLWGYFRSKEELFAAVIEEVAAAFLTNLADILGPSEDLEQGLYRFCQSFMRTIESPDAVATWRLVSAESGRFPEVGRIFYERAASFTETTLAEFLSRHVGKELRQEDPRQMAILLIGLCVGQQNRLMWGIDAPDPGRIDAHAAQFTDVFLRAYRADAAP